VAATPLTRESTIGIVRGVKTTPALATVRIIVKLKTETLRGHQMNSPPDYATLVSEAEKAVQGVTDPELKRIAFQKILDDLIQGRNPERRGTAKQPKKKRTRRPLRPSGKGSTSRRGTMAYIQELVEEGFFKKQKTISDLKAELENRGHHIPLTSLSGPLQQLVRSRVLRRQRSDGSEGKKTYLYSNW
jgi:hypothetical protein